jgi:putative phage-type endonuclease
MKTLDLVQGSPEWLAHRATHFNASDAPAMMGCSKHKTRTQLLHELKTGLTAEVDAGTQRRFDDGHRFEALARPLAEQIIGEDLYPVVGTEGELSASFDGLTMAEDVAFEHKTLNDELRAAMTTMDGAALPLAYRVQMEQQCLVSGCEKILFMATRWHGGDLAERREAWYLPDRMLRAQIVAGWAQFAADLADYVPPVGSTVEKVVAEVVEALPAPFVQVTGTLSLQDNFKVFEERLRDFLDNRLIREPKTDEDFVNLDSQIKAMKQGRAALKSAKAQMLAQVDPIDMASKAADALDKLLQQNCSMAEDLLKNEKERRRGEIVAGGVSALRTHIEGLNARLGKPYMPTVQVDFGGAVKGLKSLKSMEDKVDGELARAKIEASGIADRIQINLNTLREIASAHTFLFPDTAQIVLKAAEDLTALAKNRIAEHDEKERVKAEDLRAKIAAEEKAKAEAAVRAEQEAAARAAASPVPAPTAAAPEPTPAPATAPTVIAMPQRAQPAANALPALSLGKIGTRLGFSVTADFLRSLGFEPAGRERAAVLYHESDFPHICAALIAHIEAVQVKEAA